LISARFDAKDVNLPVLINPGRILFTVIPNGASSLAKVLDQFATAPVRPAFWGYLDTDLLDDLEAVSNFLHSSQYPGDGKDVLDAEWGATGNVRWLYTSVGSVSSASPAVGYLAKHNFQQKELVEAAFRERI